MIIKKSSLEFQNVYLIKTNDKFVSDDIINEFEISSDEFLIVNSLSKNHISLLLPSYKKKNKKLLKKVGLNFKMGTSDSKFLKFIVDQEVDEYRYVFFGLTGLHNEGVNFLKTYLCKLMKEKVKVFILIDYSPNYKVTTVDLV